ncbi:MAG: hypothetical protein JXR96_23100 [Deltaproteobacteria bacterium]|nr:hypothetical protein [Deltaproteobacteria bacterium]
MRSPITSLLLLFLAVLWSACGGGGLLEDGCRSDSECKHGRVCLDGECRYPQDACSADADCPAGYSCFDGSCRICDADEDGADGAQCAGADCDDGNAAVRPGRDELCGDGLDNDCDGVADPASLCGERCAGVVCDEGFACDPDTGQCVPICSPSCEGRECGPDGCGGSCGSCPSGTHCSSEGRCEAGCEDSCPREGESRCVGNAVVRCEDGDDDGCLEWSAPVPCAEGERCADGACEACVPDCEGRQCGPDGCGGDCGPCPEGMDCQDGWCVPGCINECLPGESRCLDLSSFQACADWNGDGCFEFGPRQTCDEGTSCDEDSGRCVYPCRDECRLGQSYCTDESGYVECGYWDEDPCLEYGPRIACEDGEACDPNTGLCGQTCRDECWPGQSVCLDRTFYSECGDWDEDACLEYGPAMACDSDETCDPETGRCSGGCEDDCWPGESLCLDEYTYIECGEFDGDPCTDWSDPMLCPADSPCDFATGRCAGQTCTPDAYEPDDDPGLASPLLSGSPQSHSLCPSGDEDWWLVELVSEMSLVLETYGTWGDTRMWLYDPWMNIIAYDDDGGSDLCSLIRTGFLAPGSYWVLVNEFSNGQIDSYRIRAELSAACIPDCSQRECGPDPLCGQSCGVCPDGWTCTGDGRCNPGPGCEPDSYEPDDDRASATVLVPGVPQAHSICPAGDEDWWVFTLAEQADIAVFTFGSDGDTRMWLYDASQNELAYDDDGGNDLFSRISVGLRPGTYHVKVNEFYSNRELAVYGIRLDLL